MTPRRLPTISTINGKQVDASKAKISVFDNSLLYAEGLFETFLAIGDRVMFIEEHLDRLYRGAKVIGLKIPVGRTTLARWMNKTVRLHPSGMKKLRMTITSGEAAGWVGSQGKPQVILVAAPHVMPVKPFRLHVARWRVDQNSVFRRIKTISYAINAAAFKQAKERGYDDALLLNAADRVAEVTSANIFWVRKNRIYTPPLSAGCLDGITRRLVFREAKKLDIPLIEKNETLEKMATADELFISSSLKLTIGVSQIAHGQRKYRFPDGPVTRRLRQHLESILPTL